MKTSILLINDRDETAWSEMLREVLAHLASSRVISGEEVDSEVLHSPYDLIIIDANVVEEPAQLVSFLRSQSPDIRVVVTTAAPTWQEARAVIRAGAADYFRQTLNKEELLSIILDILYRLTYAEID